MTTRVLQSEGTVTSVLQLYKTGKKSLRDHDNSCSYFQTKVTKKHQQNIEDSGMFFKINQLQPVPADLSEWQLSAVTVSDPFHGIRVAS